MRRRATVRRAAVRLPGLVVAVAGAIGGAGCDPTTTGSRAVVGTVGRPATTVSRARAIAVILPAEGVPEAGAWEQVARLEGSETKTIVDVARPTKGQEVAAIRDALRQDVAALIVLPQDPEAVRPALTEARDRGVPVVLLERAVDLGNGSPPIVTFSPVGEAARKIVAAAAEDAQAAGFPADGPAVILTNGPGDEGGRARVAALQTALAEQKIRALPVAGFSGYRPEAKAAIQAVLKDHPDVALILAEEDQGLTAAAYLRDEMESDRRRFILAGFSAEKRNLDLARHNAAAAVVDRNLVALGRRAVRTALDLAAGQGRDLPPLIEVETPILRATGPEREGFLPKQARPSIPTKPGTDTP